ncbi:MAG: TetR/AcrR family transcriptional regulator [Pseudomonas sp.]|nr:TetR/AcrR family transcriptional regulator [Pseudomonas sp.]
MVPDHSDSSLKRGRMPAAERCEQILSAAVQVFSEQGFRCTEVQQVADLAGVGKGTIYRFYPTKDELFQAAVEDVMQRLTAQVDNAVCAIDDPLEHLRAGFKAYMAFFQAHPQAIELFVHESAEFRRVGQPRYFAYSDMRRQAWIDVYQQLIDSGRCRVNDPQQMLDVIGNLAYGSVLVNRISGRNESLDVIADQLLDMILFGVLKPASKAARD